MAEAPPGSVDQSPDQQHHRHRCHICNTVLDCDCSQPEGLPCRHRVCLACLEDLESSEDMECPLCSSPFYSNSPADAGLQSEYSPMAGTRLTELGEEREGEGKETLYMGSPGKERCEIHQDTIKCFSKERAMLVCPSCALEEAATVYEGAKEKLRSVCNQLRVLIDSIELSKGVAGVRIGQLKKNRVAQQLDELFDLIHRCVDERREKAEVEFQQRTVRDISSLHQFLASQSRVQEEAEAALASVGMDTNMVSSLQRLQFQLETLARRSRSVPVEEVNFQVNRERLPALKQILAAVGDVERVTERSDYPQQDDYEVAHPCTSFKSCHQTARTDTRIPFVEVFRSGRGAVGEGDEDDSSNEYEPVCVLGFGNREVPGAESSAENPALRLPSALTSFVCPEMTLDARRCHPCCHLDAEGVSLRLRVKPSRPASLVRLNVLRRSARPYRFLGTRGTRALGGRVYWEVRVLAAPRHEIREDRPWCEVGVATEKALDACRENGRLAASSEDHAVVTVKLQRAADGRVWADFSSSGLDLPTAVLPPSHNPLSSVVTLGFLLDVPGQALSIVDAANLGVLCRCAVPTAEPLFPVCCLEARRECGAAVRIQLQSGPLIELTPAKRALMEGLLARC